MKLLAIDSSQDFYSIAVSINDRIIYHEFLEKNSISKSLIFDVDSALKKANIKFNDIDFFVANPGPGSFTGIRVAISTLQALELVSKKPLYGINMLEAIAICNREEFYKYEKSIIALNAGLSHVYIQTFDSKLEATSPISRIKIVDMDTNIHIFSNNVACTNRPLVKANAATILEALDYKLSNNHELTHPIPEYVY